jgi:RNA polymerase sigma-70 factor (ECF subfamily)
MRRRVERVGADQAASFDERRAVERAQQGEPDAFEELVRRYGQPVLSLCYSSALNHGDAEDLAQDVFLAAWRGLRSFRGQSAFSTWLFALARNRCIDWSRRSLVRPRTTILDPEAAATSYEVDPASARTTAAIFSASAELSLPLRQALLLRDVQGLSYEEISTLQGAPVGTIRSRIAAARIAVARAVSDE